MVVLTARLILSQPKNHVFSQPLRSDLRISLAPPDSRIQGHLLIKPLINADYRVIRGIRAPSIYKKSPFYLSLIVVVYLLLYLLYKIVLTNRIEINIANNAKLRANTQYILALTHTIRPKNIFLTYNLK